MKPERLARIEQALSCRVRASQPVHGGDINDAYRLDLHGGERVFVKTHAHAPSDMYRCEADGLEWLRAGPLRVPQVLHVEADFLVLEWIEQGRPDARSEERLGQGLAELHRIGSSQFGWSTPNYLATIRFENEPEADWPTFYAEKRLRPLLRMVEARGFATPTMRRGLENVLARIDTLCGQSEPPSRLHGDLWGGNVLYDSQCEPVLIDPAVYGGHREIDLAMMRLFGGFSARVFDAYEQTFPLAEDSAGRTPLYQLLPLLAHVHLFGRSYVSAVEEAIRRLAAC